MKTLIAILVAMLSATLCATAQLEDNVWIYAGNRIDFNTEPPTVTTVDVDYHTERNVTSVADAEGNLVYWLNGASLYNSNNEVIYSLPNASGGAYFYGLSIVPFPNRDKVYLFVYPDAANGKLVVSLADGSKDLLHPEITERYAEFPYYEPHYMGGAADGVPMFFQKFGSRDYWLLYAYQGKIKVYALTKDGFSYTGKSYNLPTPQEMGYDGDYYLNGCEMSPDRSKIFITTSPWWYCTIFIDLDTKTGDIKVINHFRVYVMEAYAFSSGNKYMYFAYERLLYRISVENLARCTSDEDFMAYREVVGLLHCDFGDMKFLTSGGLYFLNNDSGEYIGAVLDCDSEHPVINNQWLKLARNVHDYGDGRSIAFPKTYCYPYGFSTEESCGGEVRFVFTDDSSYESLSWDFGDGSTSTEVSPVHKYKANGKYNVTLTVNYPTGDRPVLTVKKDLLVTSLMRKLVIVEE